MSSSATGAGAGFGAGAAAGCGAGAAFGVDEPDDVFYTTPSGTSRPYGL
jgi:hypothetical protein